MVSRLQITSRAAPLTASHHLPNHTPHTFLFLAVFGTITAKKEDIVFMNDSMDRAHIEGADDVRAATIDLLD